MSDPEVKQGVTQETKIEDPLRHLDLNSPEAKKRAEEENKEYQKLADSILVDSLKCEVTDLQNDVLLSCLREDGWLYKEYAETLKEYPEYKKYFQLYNFKGKPFLVVPIFDKQENKFAMKTVEVAEKDGKTTLVGHTHTSWETEYPQYAKNPNVITVKFADESAEIGYTTISMNKWTGEISNIEPNKYKQGQKGVDALIGTIGEKAGVKLENCSTALQSNVKDILSKEDKLKENSSNFEEQKNILIQNVMQNNFIGAVNAFLDLIKSFFKSKKDGRVMDLGNELTYEGDEKDVEYLESAINTVLDSEQRSKFTYMLSKIKDKHMKEQLKEKGEENPSQYDLMLQQLKPGQVMLTNALDTNGGSSTFKYATQAVAGSRWCHALIISEVVRDDNGIVTDAKIVQSTLKGGVHETTLKKYIKENYSAADFLLADVPEGKADDIIANARSKIGEKYDRVSIVTDAVMGYDVDGTATRDAGKDNAVGRNKSYCSELVFDAMSKSGIKLPEPHMSPADIITTDIIKPQYACYCNKFE